MRDTNIVSPYSFVGISKAAIILAEKHRETPSEYIDKIIQVVADYTEVSYLGMKAKSRKRELVFARQAAMYFIAKNMPKLSLAAIGKKFGGRDHSTVIHAKSTIEDLMITDKRVKDDIDNLNSMIIRIKP